MLHIAMQPAHLPGQGPIPGHAHRWKMTPENKLRLQQAFDEMPYPTREAKTALANELGVRKEQVAKWFQHRREALSKLGQFKGQAMRARRTEEEKQILQEAYDRNPYPSQSELAALSQLMQNVTEKQIKLWFKHKRKQMKKKGELTPRRRSARLTTELPQVEPVPEPFVEFSRDDLMALRGALAVGGPEPSLACMERLAQMLNRPLPMIQNWFLTRGEGSYQQGQDAGNIFGKTLPAKVVEDDSASQNAQNPKRRKMDTKGEPGPFCSGLTQQPCTTHFASPYRGPHPAAAPPGSGITLAPHLKVASVDGQPTALPSVRDFPPLVMVPSNAEQPGYVDTTSAAQPIVDPGLMVDPNAYNRQVVSSTYTVQPKSWLVTPSQPQPNLPDAAATINPAWPSTT